MYALSKKQLIQAILTAYHWDRINAETTEKQAVEELSTRNRKQLEKFLCLGHL